MSEFNLELVVYDETEYFRDYNDPDFSYPYIQRKTLIDSQKLSLPLGDENPKY